MNWEQIAGILRHILTFGGGFLVARGIIDASVLPELIAAVITISGLIWSFIRKTPASVVSQAAAMVPVPAASQKEVGIVKPLTPSGASKTT